MSIGIVIAAIVVLYSTFKTVYIGRRKTESTLLGYDMTVFDIKKAKEFSNLIVNGLVNATFIVGVIIFIIDYTTEFGMIAGIVLAVLVIVIDIVMLKVLIPKEYEKMKG